MEETSRFNGKRDYFAKYHSMQSLRRLITRALKRKANRPDKAAIYNEQIAAYQKEIAYRLS